MKLDYKFDITVDLAQVPVPDLENDKVLKNIKDRVMDAVAAHIDKEHVKHKERARRNRMMRDGE